MKTLGLRSSGCDTVQLGQIVFGKDQGWRGKILPQVRDRSHARNQKDIGRATKQPRERDLHGRGAQTLRYIRQRR